MRCRILASMPFPLSLPDLPLHVLLVAPLIVLLGYTIFGATGFGSSIISVPGLAHFFPLTFTVPLITTTDAFAATSTALRLRRARRLARSRATARRPMLIGITLGATLLAESAARSRAAGARGVRRDLRHLRARGCRAGSRSAPDWLVWPVGVVGGVFSALFGTGGPIYIVFLSARIDDKSALRATSAIVVAVSVWIRLALFIATGLLLDATLLVMLVAMLLPVMALGLWLGNRLHHALSGRGVLRLIAACCSSTASRWSFAQSDSMRASAAAGACLPHVQSTRLSDEQALDQAHELAIVGRRAAAVSRQPAGRCGRRRTCRNSTAARRRCWRSAREQRIRADLRHARLLEHRKLHAVREPAELRDLLVRCPAPVRRNRSTESRRRRDRGPCTCR